MKASECDNQFTHEALVTEYACEIKRLSGITSEWALESISTKIRLLADQYLVHHITTVGERIANALFDNQKVLVCGNGGSSGDSGHFVGELMNKFSSSSLRPPLPAVDLSANSSILTAIANDFGYGEVFGKQIQALGHTADVFVGISTSGKSENVMYAIKVAKEKNLLTVLLTGGEANDDVADYVIKVPSSVTPVIQECHIMIIHIWCQIIDYLFDKRRENDKPNIKSGV